MAPMHTTRDAATIAAEIAAKGEHDRTLAARQAAARQDADARKAHRDRRVADGADADEVARLNRELVALREDLDGFTGGRAALAKQVKVLRAEHASANRGEALARAMAAVERLDDAVRRACDLLQPLVDTAATAVREASQAELQDVALNGGDRSPRGPVYDAGAHHIDPLLAAVAPLLAYAATSRGADAERTD